MLELKEGEYYLNGNGNVVGPMVQDPESIEAGVAYVFRSDGDGTTYRSDGRWGVNPSGVDLVEHLPVTDERHPKYVASVNDGWLKLQVGEWYVRRNGGIAGPLVHNPEAVTYVFSDGVNSFTENGHLWSSNEDSLDLIRHLPVTDERHPKYVPPASEPEPETVEVTVRLPKLETGYRYTGEFRPALFGELSAGPDGVICGGETTCSVWIIVKDWTPPACLSSGWAFADNDGECYWSDQEPTLSGNDALWRINGNFFRLGSFLKGWTDPPIRGKEALWRIL